MPGNSKGKEAHDTHEYKVNAAKTHKLDTRFPMASSPRHHRIRAPNSCKNLVVLRRVTLILGRVGRVGWSRASGTPSLTRTGHRRTGRRVSRRRRTEPGTRGRVTHRTSRTNTIAAVHPRRGWRVGGASRGVVRRTGRRVQVGTCRRV